MGERWIIIFGFAAGIMSFLLMLCSAFGLYQEEMPKGKDAVAASQLGSFSFSQKDREMAKLHYKEGEVLVRFKKGVSLTTAKSAVFSRSMFVAIEFKFLSQKRRRTYLLLRSEKMTTKDMMAALQKHPWVEAISPNYIRRIDQTTIPDDPSFAELWGLHNIGQTLNGVSGTPDADIDAPEAWEKNTGSSDIVVAVIDTGVDYTHPDLVENMWVNPGEIPGNNIDDDGNGYIDDIYGHDFASDYLGRNDSDPMDFFDHGTHVSGTIAAVGDNGIGIVGVNWHTKIMALKAARPPFWRLPDSDTIEAIEYTTLMKENYGVNIVAINASWGGVDYNPILKDAIEEACNEGIIFCAAAGNDRSNTDAFPPYYPCTFDLPNIISVAATDQSDNLADFSNYGFSSVDLGAPGVKIKSTIPASLGTQASVTVDSTNYTAYGMTHAGHTEAEGITALAYDCGLGYLGDFPPEVNGNIALIERGELWFMQKAFNAQIAGAVAVIIYNNSPGIFQASLVDMPWDWVPVVSVSMEDGQALVAKGIPTVTVVNVHDPVNAYFTYDGTSMAAPHVTGAVALMTAEYPSEDLLYRVDRILSGVDSLTALEGKVATEGRLNIANSIDPDLIFNPFITFSPTIGILQGAQTAFITINGIEFGTSRGDVVFVDESCEKYADIDYWSDTNIIALVPASAGKYLFVRREDGRDSNVKTISMCPIEATTRDQSKLNLCRRLRDEVLSLSETGRRYVELYYKHFPEATLHLLKNSKLRSQARKLLGRVIPEIRLILDKKKEELSPGLKKGILTFLNNFSKKASPELKASIERVKADIEDGRIKELLCKGKEEESTVKKRRGVQLNY